MRTDKKIETMADTVSSAKSASGVAWDLSALYAAHDDPRISADLQAVDARAQAFEQAYRGKIAVAGGPTPELLLAVLRASEAITDAVTRIGYYGSLLYAADTTKHEHRALLQKNEQALVALRNRVMFFELEWVAVEADAAKALIAHPLLANYRHALDHGRRYQPHTLSEPEERIMNEKEVTGMSAWGKLFTEFLGELTYPMTQPDGSVRQLNQSEILVQLRAEDRATRQRAHETFYSVMRAHSNVLTFIYDTRFQDELVNVRLRGYDSPAAPRHLANDVSATAVQAMMQTVERNFPLAHRYWKLKAQMLGLPHLELYDQYAPLPEAKQRISYDEAGTHIINAMQKFSPEFAHLTQQFFENSWIDADPRPGKRGGAFCAGITPALHPVILMSYNDDLRDVMTLAHELGHGLHDMLAREQTITNYYPSLPIAETASVFAEMLTFDELLAGLDDPRQRLALLCGKIEDSFSTVFRQTVLTRFEELAYAARAQGRLNAEAIGKLWLQANAPYYGESLHMTPGYELGWSYIPHFINTPFYCYAYSFGQLLVLALYGQYRKLDDDAMREDFIKRYRALLAAGSSQTPAELVAGVGFDLNDPNFWQIGFDELARLVAQAEALAA